VTGRLTWARALLHWRQPRAIEAGVLDIPFSPAQKAMNRVRQCEMLAGAIRLFTLVSCRYRKMYWTSIATAWPSG